jgi:hypothetical protein
MSNVADILNDDDFFAETSKGSEISTKTPKPQWTPFADGEYFGHIVDVEKRTVDTHGGKHKALVFNFMVRVADENSTKEYVYPWGNTTYTASGSEYVGKNIKAIGVFKFLNPNTKEGETFEAYPDGNKRYVLFCENIGVELPTSTREIDGEKVTVKALPTLTEKDITGTPVIAVVGEGKKYTNRNGKEVTPKEVKFVKTWKDGKKLEIADEADIPF